MKFKHRKIATEGAWLTFGQLIGIAGGVVGIRLITELLSPDEYGLLNIGIMVSVFFTSVVYGPLAQSVTRYYSVSFTQGELNSYVTIIKNFLSDITIVIAFFFIASGVVVTANGRLDLLVFMMLIFLFVVLSGINSTISSLQNSARKRKNVALHQIADNWLRFLVAAITIIYIMDASAQSAMFGYVIALFMISFSQYYFLVRGLNVDWNFCSIEPSLKANMIKCAKPFSIWGVFTWIQLTADRWALSLFLGVSELGLYSIVFQLAFFSTILFPAIMQRTLMPIVYQYADNNSDYARMVKSIKITNMMILSVLFLTVCIFIFTLAFHSAIFYIIAAENFHTYSYLLPWSVLSGGILASSQIFIDKMTLQLRTGELTFIKVVVSIIGVIVSFSLVYLYGVEGAVASSLIYACLHFVALMKISRMKSAVT